MIPIYSTTLLAGWYSSPGRLLKKKEKEMTEDELKEIKKINQMSQIEMAKLWRFAPSGHLYFDVTKPYFKIFEKRFWEDFGGFTPAISKAIGW